MSEQFSEQPTQTALDEFIQKIADETGLSSLPDEEKEPLIANLELEIQRRLGLVALSYLGEEDSKEFVSMTTQNPQPSPQEVATFLQNHILDFERIMADTLAELYREFTASAQAEL